MKPIQRRGWRCGVLVLLLLASPWCAFGQSPTWESVGPEGGTIAAVVQDPVNKDIVYVATYGYPSVIFRTTNRGEEWEKVSSIESYVSGLTIPRAAPTTLLATTWGGVFQSADGGQTWTYVSLPQSGGLYYYLYQLAVDPEDARIYHVAAESWDGVQWKMVYLKSTTGGAAWEVRQLSTVASSGWAVAVDPLDGQVVYVGGYTTSGDFSVGKLMKSTDGGGSFSDITGSIIGYIYSIYADSMVAGRVFVGTYAGVFKSTDGGAAWRQAYIPAPYYFQVNPANPSEVFAGTVAGVARSTTGGDSWLDASTGIQGSGAGGLVLDPDNAADLMFANVAGVYRTSNGGSLWTECNGGLLAARITAIRCAPSNPTTLLAAFYGNAVYGTSDAIASEVPWQRLPQFYDCENIEDILILPTDPNVIYAMEGGG